MRFSTWLLEAMLSRNTAPRYNSTDKNHSCLRAVLGSRRINIFKSFLFVASLILLLCFDRKQPLQIEVIACSVITPFIVLINKMSLDHLQDHNQRITVLK